MDAQERTRSCFRERMPQNEGTPRGSKQICIPTTADIYDRIWNDAGRTAKKGRGHRMIRVNRWANAWPTLLQPLARSLSCANYLIIMRQTVFLTA